MAKGKPAAQRAQVQTSSTEEQDQVEQDLVAQDPYDVLDGKSVQEAVAAPLGAPNDYPYLDKTALPVHERNFSNMNADFGPSQSDLNPGFTAKPDDGGPSGEGVIEGTEPNADEKALAAAENSGQEGAVEAVQESIDAGKDAQMDADKVNADAQDRAPAGVDASTGQKEGQA